MNRKKVLVSIGIILVLLLSIVIFKFNKSTDNITIDNVSLNNLDNNKSKLFAIMISENNGSDYHECDSSICNNSSFPNSAYIYQKADCIDDRGETAKDVTVTYQNNQAKVTSNKTVYCTLYFNKDTTKPTITSFYIKNTNTQPKYSNNTSKQENATLTWSDKDVVSYCIIDTNNVTNCDSNSNWKQASNNSAILPLTLTEGSNTYYAFLKDVAGNTSALDNNQASMSDTIVLDTVAPTVDYDIKSGEYTGPQTITITVNDTGSGIQSWSVHTHLIGRDDGTIPDWTKSQDNIDINTKSYQVTIEEGTWTIFTIVYDKAGNVQNQIPSSRDYHWYYQTYTIKAKLGGDYVNDKVTGNVGSGGYASTGISTDPLAKRFYGSDPNNYICFGASTCQNNDDHMYRIIGITTDGRLKLMKQKSLGGYYWHWSSRETAWDSATIREQLNGISTGDRLYPSDIFYINETLVPSSWKKYIDQNPSWCIGNVSSSYTGGTALGSEMSNCKTIENSPIGLIYLSDFIFSKDGKGNLDCNDVYCMSWMFTENLWTMNSAARTSHAWYLGYSDTWAGTVYVAEINNYKKINPVFYLVSNIKLSGTGKVDDPFIITGLA